MLGKVKELIIQSSEADADIMPQLSDRVVSALELKPETDCIVTVNGSEFEVSKGEVLSFPYNFMKIDSLKFTTSGIKAKIRYLEE